MVPKFFVPNAMCAKKNLQIFCMPCGTKMHLAKVVPIWKKMRFKEKKSKFLLLSTLRKCDFKILQILK